MFFASQGTEYCKIDSLQNPFIPIHINNGYEIYFITEGELAVTVDQNQKRLRSGEAAFVFPNQIHSADTSARCRCIRCAFSQNFISQINNGLDNAIPESPFINLDRFGRIGLELISERQDTLMVESGIILTYSVLKNNINFIKKPNFDSLLYKVLYFTEDNFSKECSLKRVADFLKYDYTYLSKFFLKTTGITYNDYLNLRRVKEACRLLTTTSASIGEIAALCGFGSLRSLNRNFYELLSTTPAIYRKQPETFTVKPHKASAKAKTKELPVQLL